MKVKLKTATIVRERFLQIYFPAYDIITKRRLRHIPKIRNNEYSCEVLLTHEVVKELDELGFTFSKSLQNWYDKKEKRKLSNAKMDISHIPKLGGTLYKYQIEGVNHIENKGGRALIADEMGLGKTVQALAWIQLHSHEVKPVVVVCPSSLKINWKRETLKWAPDMIPEILSGQTPYSTKGDFLIINYDILPFWEQYLKSKNIVTVIGDEVHLTKSNQAKRTKAFKRLVRDVDYIVALTGTPIENRPVEVYNIIQAIDFTLFPNYIKFAMRYCNAKKGRFGWDMSGSSNTMELHDILVNSIMIRRKKKDVLKELPPKQIAKVALEIDNRVEYTKAENEFVRYIQDKFRSYSGEIEESVKKELKQYAKDKGLEVNEELSDSDIENIKQEKLKSAKNAPMFASIETLKQLAVKGKMKQITDWIEDFLESGEKLVVFAVHRKVIDHLTKHFKGSVKIDGSVSMSKRQDVVDSFQNDPKVKLLIGNIKAAGVGITLTAASNVAMIQFPWSPGELVQAEDRVHRISQLKQVTIYYLVGEDTIEEKIIDILIRKEKIINQVLDGASFSDESVLSELIKSYK